MNICAHSSTVVSCGAETSLTSIAAPFAISLSNGYTDTKTITKNELSLNFVSVWICRVHVCVYRNQDKRLNSTKNGHFLNESDHQRRSTRACAKRAFISAFTPYWSFPYVKISTKLNVSLECYCARVNEDKTNQATRQPSLNGERKRDIEWDKLNFIFEKTKKKKNNERARVCALTFTCCNQNNKSVYCAP